MRNRKNIKKWSIKNWYLSINVIFWGLKIEKKAYSCKALVLAITKQSFFNRGLKTSRWKKGINPNRQDLSRASRIIGIMRKDSSSKIQFFVRFSSVTSFSEYISNWSSNQPLIMRASPLNRYKIYTFFFFSSQFFYEPSNLSKFSKRLHWNIKRVCYEKYNIVCPLFISF